MKNTTATSARETSLQLRKRSPIEQPPLPRPGDSLQQEILELGLGRVVPWAAAATISCVFAGLEWLRWWKPYAAKPIPLTLGAIILTVAAVVVWRRTVIRMAQSRLGMIGERAVGQMLERLRTEGHEVFHDIEGDGFNIDHVLIGPGGAFVIETKTISKRNDVLRNEVRYNGQSVLVNGFTPDRDPIAQVSANARGIGRLLEGEPPRRPLIRPVVLYPGWWVETTAADPQAWVMNDKQFFAAVRRAPERLPKAEVRSLATVLRMHVRTQLSEAS